MSQSLRFDPHIARAKEIVRGGTIGTPKTLELGWSFDGADTTTAAVDLVDVACWLLDSGPASIYAVASEGEGPPLVKINLLTASGAIATIEVAGEADEVPTRRDLHLLATDGEIVHRIGKDDLLWGEGRAWPLAGGDEVPTRDVAADGWAPAVWQGLERSLATGEMVQLAEGIG
jgi:predicted dehydrogenase